MISLGGSDRKNEREGMRNIEKVSAGETERPASVGICLQGISGALPSSSREVETASCSHKVA